MNLLSLFNSNLLFLLPVFEQDINYLSCFPNILTVVARLAISTITVSLQRSSRLFTLPRLFPIQDTIIHHRTPARRQPLRRSSRMPAQIDIVEPVEPVRDLEADEEYVINAFERHASNCSRCANPLGAHRENHSLCERGNRYAIDVSEYLYSKNRKAYSVLDRDLTQPTLVKVPRDRRAVHALLCAIEDGLHLNRRGGAASHLRRPPVITYDQTYPVPPRRSATAPQHSIVYTEIIERQPRDSKGRRVTVYSESSPRSSHSRGSLYESDAAERRRSRQSPRIYRLTEYHF
ncbi:hypothetical protein BDV28DRAFT_130584 [Aspergillus coremiiformis]|uniref:Uncharacterized protein n=1 Tax=Aspergillus coremiiformis TaxID=138285 RepID=A0A5N6ZAI3_9EURO|nr:hypothetical protein BDV28DRAFT_130584 [Aspergillus coremiiformis]